MFLTRFRTYKIALPPQTKTQEGRGPQTDRHLPQSPFTGQFFLDSNIWCSFLSVLSFYGLTAHFFCVIVYILIAYVLRQGFCARHSIHTDRQTNPLFTRYFNGEGKFEYKGCDSTEQRGLVLEDRGRGACFVFSGKLKRLTVPMASAEMLIYKLVSVVVAVIKHLYFT